MSENDFPQPTGPQATTPESEVPHQLETPPFTTPAGAPMGNPTAPPAGPPAAGPGGIPGGSPQATWGPPTTAPVAGPTGFASPPGPAPNYYSQSGYQPQGPGSYTEPPNDGPIRTAYSALDGLLGLIWAVVGFVGSLVIALLPIFIWLFTREGGISPDFDEADLPTSALAISTIVSQALQGLWPLFVARWLPGVKWSDLRLGFKLIDLPIGFGVALIGLFTAGIAGYAMSLLVGLEDQEDASNTAFLTDAQGSPWFYLLVVAVVIGAPLSEEMFFRGLIMGSFENIGGGLAARGSAVSMDSVRAVAVIVGVVGSTLIFTAPHWIGGTAKETMVLFASIGAVGAVFAIAAVITKRLGASMVAHALFNSMAVLSAVGAFDGLTQT